jgi:predicted nucleotidyltransferase
MKALTVRATTATLRLDDVIARLAAQPSVAGILLLGSTATGALTPASDYDLLVVFDELPAPLRLVTTWVDGRLTEVYCTTLDAVRRVVATVTEIPASGEAGAIVTWLRSGRLVHDRRGELLTAQAAARTTVRPTPATDDEVYETWRKAGYSVAQMKRYLAAGDPTSDLAVDMRLLYGLADVMVGYFTARRLAWQGERAAIRHWAANDPDFLERFRAALAERDRRRRVELYEELARDAVAPIGELWPVGATMIGLGWGYASGNAAMPVVTELGDAQAAWASLTAPRHEEPNRSQDSG